MKTILVIEDDTSISEELKELLDNAGYKSFILKDFDNVYDEFLKIHPDLLLLDINIPKINGKLLLKNIRKDNNVPVIMVTSSQNETDQILAMSYGADDYIIKPYNPIILLLRIEALFRRVDNISEVLNYKGVSVIPQKGMLIKDKQEITLTKNEMIIFVFLLNRKGKIVSRDELMTDLWNNEEYVNDNALTVNISRLRSKLNELGFKDAILTRKNQGYLLL